MTSKKKFYAVAVGRNPGIYTQWFGNTGAHAQVKGFPGARYKGFATIEQARCFIEDHGNKGNRKNTHGSTNKKIVSTDKALLPTHIETDSVVIYTDGSSLGNPGPGGYGVVIPSAKGDRELSGGFRHTTNNRMELFACIVGLEQMHDPTKYPFTAIPATSWTASPKGGPETGARTDGGKAMGSKL